MKKILKTLCVLALTAACLAGCGQSKAPAEDGAGKINVVCTTFPQYDWVKNLLGEVAEVFEVTLLVKNSADIHNYQPSAQDVIAMKEADLFLYVGGESDVWVTDLMRADAALKEKSVSLTEALGESVLHEELSEEGGHAHLHEKEDEAESIDEHVWLSLKNAGILCRYISERLTALAPDRTEEISESTDAYLEKLQALDMQYQEMVASSAKKTLIFGDRFPFSYLAKDYDLSYYAAFSGCNAEVEVGFDTIITLAEQADVCQASCILVIDGSDKSLANSILNTAKDSDKEILVLDSMQSVSSDDIEQGAAYLDIMNKNLEVLRKALN